jgi:hypothetical protein
MISQPEISLSMPDGVAEAGGMAAFCHASPFPGSPRAGNSRVVEADENKAPVCQVLGDITPPR